MIGVVCVCECARVFVHALRGAGRQEKKKKPLDVVGRNVLCYHFARPTERKGKYGMMERIAYTIVYIFMTITVCGRQSGVDLRLLLQLFCYRDPHPFPASSSSPPGEMQARGTQGGI